LQQDSPQGQIREYQRRGLQMSAQKNGVKSPDNSRMTSCLVQMSAQNRLLTAEFDAYNDAVCADVCTPSDVADYRGCEVRLLPNLASESLCLGK
jgi:hypothetical protein